MEVFMLSASAAVFVYFIICLAFGAAGMDNTKQRISSLYAKNNIENVHDDVLKEQQKKLISKKSKNLNSISRNFENFLSMSGVKLSAREFVYAWCGTTFIPIILLIACGCNAITAAGIGILGFAVPPLLVRRAKNKRQLLFSRQLGEALIIMGNCLKSGYSFQQAMESISTDMQPPISHEFSKTLREIRYGVKPEDALNHMVDRVKDKDLDLLVSAIITSSQVGGNLSEILDTISSTIKDRLRIRDEVRILTSSGRISGIIIGLLPVIITLFLMVINPAYIETFFDNIIGKIMLCAAVILESVGFIIVNKIVDIKY